MARASEGVEGSVESLNYKMNTEEQLLIIGQVISNINQYVIKIILDPLLD